MLTAFDRASSVGERLAKLGRWIFVLAVLGTMSVTVYVVEDLGHRAQTDKSLASLTDDVGTIKNVVAGDLRREVDQLKLQVAVGVLPVAKDQLAKQGESLNELEHKVTSMQAQLRAAGYLKEN
jgi:hypothetical protein